MSQTGEEVFPGYPNLETYSLEFLKTMGQAVRDSNGMPSERKEDWDYYSTFKSFRQVAKVQQEKIEKLIQNVLKSNGIKTRGTPANVTEMLELLADANDHILERANSNLDEFSGVNKKVDPLILEVTQSGKISGSWNKKPDSINQGNKSFGESNSEGIRLLAARNVARPQLNFKDKIDNSTGPFMPRITEKPHSMKPLSILIEYDDKGNECYSHPYVFEIDNFKMPSWQMETKKGNEMPKELANTPWTFVDNTRLLKEMIDDLSKYTVIGVDLEAHSYRSYLGITCLIQISSESKDYLVDPFPLWSELSMLNEVFANPKILKLMHGAAGDIGWLQRDFSVYVVNMFDTHIAAKILEFPRGCLSLAYLLHHYCKVSAEKRFQLADWRIRPLVEEMVDYARTDTHYLIYIYNRMKDELLDKGNDQKNLLKAAYDHSNDLCKNVFTKPLISHLSLLQRSKVNFNSRQSFAFKEIYLWRNKVARTEDESEAYVLPTHMLIKISTELPREMQGILACCNPIPPLVKQSLLEIHQIILKARDLPVTLIPLSESTTLEEDASQGTKSLSGPDEDLFENPLKCPLDLGPLASQSSDDLGVRCVLDKDFIIKNMKQCSIRTKETPSICLLGQGSENSKSKANLKDFLTPFQRFQLLRPYMRALNDNQENRTRTDEERMKSIREHFDALTAMSAKDFQEESKSQENDVLDHVEENEEEEEDEEAQPISSANFNPDPILFKSLRQNLSSTKESKSQRKRPGQMGPQDLGKKRRKSKGKVVNDKAKELDLADVDFSQFSGGSKKAPGESKDFNPWKDYDKKGKNLKKRQNYKRAGKSVTYK